LIRRWDKINDIDLATNVLGTEFFASELKPLPLPIRQLRSILVIAPHQDDEAIGAGGSLLIASTAGAKINVLYVTDGAAKNASYADGPADASHIRNQEAREVCKRIGATMHQLNISNLSPSPTIEQVDQLAEIICELDPQVIMAPWILDSPAKHRLVNHLLWLAHQRKRLPSCEVWGYQVHNTLIPNGYVDITEEAEKKLELLRCFKSQIEFGQCYDHLAMGMAAWNARFLERSSQPRYVETFFTIPMSEHLRLVETFYFTDLETTYRGDQKVLQGAHSIHEAVTRRPVVGKSGSPILFVKRREA
jgi:LmbE family N-acetylglucosaminyl deacetylase